MIVEVTRCVFVPDDYRKPVMLVGVMNGFKGGPGYSGNARCPGLFIPLHRDDDTPRFVRR